MNKSVLIIGTPECCANCNFLDDKYDYPWCIASGDVKGYSFNPHAERMNTCPLIPLEKVCKMAVETHEEEVKAQKNTILCGACYHYFDPNRTVFPTYSDWFEDEAKGGGSYKWRYVKHWVRCPECGDLVLKDYHTERKEEQ